MATKPGSPGGRRTVIGGTRAALGICAIGLPVCIVMAVVEGLSSAGSTEDVAVFLCIGALLGITLVLLRIDKNT